MVEINNLKHDIEALSAEREALRKRSNHSKPNVTISLKVLEMQNR